MKTHSHPSRALVITAVAASCFAAGLLARAAATQIGDFSWTSPAISAGVAPPLIGWPLLRIFPWP